MRSRALTIALRIAAALVAALHAALLAQRIEDLSITRPDVIARWLAAALLAAGALHLLHRRVSWRAWLVFAIAVLLMHAGAPPQAVFAVAPLIAIAIGFTICRPRDTTRFAGMAGFAFHSVAPHDCTADRAPPHC